MENEELEQDNEQYDESEPTYECEYDYPCQCHNDGVEGEWEWDTNAQCWVCTGCGETQ